MSEPIIKWTTVAPSKVILTPYDSTIDSKVHVKFMEEDTDEQIEAYRKTFIDKFTEKLNTINGL